MSLSEGGLLSQLKEVYQKTQNSEQNFVPFVYTKIKIALRIDKDILQETVFFKEIVQKFSNEGMRLFIQMSIKKTYP